MGPDLTEIFGSYMSWKINEDTWIINSMEGSQNMYLLEGTESALLIDTLWGAGNLRGHVESLTEHIFTGDAQIEDKLNHKYAEAGDPEHRLCRVRWKKASFFVVKADLMALWGSGLPEELS